MMSAGLVLPDLYHTTRAPYHTIPVPYHAIPAPRYHTLPGRFGRRVSVTGIYHTVPYHHIMSVLP